MGHSEFLVFGAGPAGTAAAIALTRAGARVTLIERALSPHFKPGEIIEPMVRYPLSALGLFDRFRALSPLVVSGNLSLWGDDDPIEAAAILNPHGSGYLVERQSMEQWLIEEAAAAGVTVLLGRRQVRVDAVGSRYAATWEEDGRHRTVSPAVIVDATGRGTGVVGTSKRRRLDRLVALLAYPPVISRGVQDQRLYIEAANNGWWYSAPLPGDRMVVALMTDADLVPRGRAAQSKFFAESLEETHLTSARIGALKSGFDVRSYPAASTIREQLGGSHWMAIGDAAATHDPLLGRGVYYALSTGVEAARLLTESSDIDRAIETYVEDKHSRFDKYTREHQAVYDREAKRRCCVFWQRRLVQ